MEPVGRTSAFDAAVAVRGKEALADWTELALHGLSIGIQYLKRTGTFPQTPILLKGGGDEKGPQTGQHVRSEGKGLHQAQDLSLTTIIAAAIITAASRTAPQMMIVLMLSPLLFLGSMTKSA